MEGATKPQTGLRENRGFILGSLSLGHGISHLVDQGFPLLLTAIADYMGLGTIQKAALFAIRQSGSSITSLGAGPFVDALKPYWGLILTGCMIWAAVAYSLVGISPSFAVLVIAVLFIAIPGALWHLPAAAAISQRFPDRRGFAISMHGFGSNIGNALGPVLAGALLGILLWRNIFFIYAIPAIALSIFVWWSLRNVGKEGGQEGRKGLRAQLDGALTLLKNPVVLGLILAALLRGMGLNALFNWTPFYLKDELGMNSLEAGVHYALLTGMGIISAPVIGALSDRFGRKAILVPGMTVAAFLSMLVVSVGDSLLLILVLAGIGLFTFVLHNIIQAAVLDAVGRGTEATATGLLFGVTGVLGGASPFLASLIIDHLGGLGSIFYYSGILTAVTAVIVFMIPLRSGRRTPAATGA